MRENEKQTDDPVGSEVDPKVLEMGCVRATLRQGHSYTKIL